MTAHMVTVMSYIVLGLGLIVPTWKLIFTPTDWLREKMADILTSSGVIFVIQYRRIIEMYLMLFGIFIFSCAVDHFTADHPHMFAEWFVAFAAQAEAIVSGVTALLFAIGPVAVIWRRFVFRKLGEPM